MRALVTCLSLLAVLLLGLWLGQGVEPEVAVGATPAGASGLAEVPSAGFEPDGASSERADSEGAGRLHAPHAQRREVLPHTAPGQGPELFVQFTDAWGEPLPFLRTRLYQAHNAEALSIATVSSTRVADTRGRLQVMGAEGLSGTVLGLEPYIEGLQRIVIEPEGNLEAYVDGVRLLRLEVGYWRVELLDERNRPSGGGGTWTHDLEGLKSELDAWGNFANGSVRGSTGLTSRNLRPSPDWSEVRAGETLLVARELAGRLLWARLEDGSYSVLIAARTGRRSTPGVLQLPVFSPGVLLRGRLASEYAGSELTFVDLVGPHTRVSQARVSVDAGGEFVVSTRLLRTQSLAAVHLIGRRSSDGRAFGGSVTLSPSLAVPGLRDLGRVEVELLPLLVEGTLAGLAGSVSVREGSRKPAVVSFPPGSPTFGPSHDTLGLGARRESASATGLQRTPVHDVTGRSARGPDHSVVVDPVDSAGRFRVWGHWPTETAWLWVGGEPVTEFQVGEQDLRVGAAR